MKTRRIFWGFLFLIAGILIIVHQLGYPIGGYFGSVSNLEVILTIVMIPIIVESLAHRNFFGILIPIGILISIHKELLGIEDVASKSIIFAAVCLSIGLTIIFRRPVDTFKKKYLNTPDTPEFSGESNEKNRTTFGETVQNSDDNEMECVVRFGEATRYVKSAEFKSAKLSCAFGSIRLFFDGADIASGGADIYLSISFGGAEIYVPKSWRVEPDIMSALAGVSEKNHPVLTSDSPVLRIKGKVNFGGIEIIYI